MARRGLPSVDAVDVDRNRGRKRRKLRSLVFRLRGAAGDDERRFRLLRGAPALLALLVSVGVLLTAHVRRHETLGRYEQLAEDLNQPEMANLAYERLIDLGESPRSLGYAWATLAFRLQQASEGTEARTWREVGLQRMAALAPTTGSGDPQAHVWMARLHLSSREEGRLVKAELHLRRALENARPPHATALLGLTLVARGQFEEGRAYLDRATDPDDRGILLQAYEVWLRRLPPDDPTRAAVFDRGRAIATGLLEQRRPRLTDDPGDVGRRRDVYAVLEFLGDYEEAAEVARAGLRLAPADRRLQRDLARILQRWAGVVTDPTRQVALRLESFAVLPFDSNLVQAMLSADDAKARERAQAAIAARLREPRVAAGLHATVGAALTALGRFEDAQPHHEAAFRAIGLRVPGPANNLAYNLVHLHPPRTDEALELIDRALQVFPNNGRLLDTRGRVLARMGRWQEAIIALQQATPSVSDRAGNLRELASAYEALEHHDLARAYEQRAEVAAARTAERRRWLFVGESLWRREAGAPAGD